jgi:hypothetical protein
MEKLIYALWNEPRLDDGFNARVQGPLKDALLALGAHRLQINLVDARVAAGAGLRQDNVRPGPAALVSFWLNSSHIRKPFEAALEAVSPRIGGYAVTESTVLPILESAPDGWPTQGFAQMALIQRPPRITHEAFLDVWLGSHTRVGVETQSNFYYCQNIVNRVLTAGAPHFAAIVEECFPLEAMTDPQVFYNAVGLPEKFESSLKEMMDSCARFIDFDRIDVMVTSEYRYGGWSDLPGQPDYPARRH